MRGIAVQTHGIRRMVIEYMVTQTKQRHTVDDRRDGNAAEHKRHGTDAREIDACTPRGFRLDNLNQVACRQ